MGFTIKTAEAIVDDIIVSIVTNVPDITDINVGSVIRTQSEAVATEINLIYQAINTVYLGTRIDTATTDDLDNLGAIVGVTRKAGTTATGDISFIRNQIALSDFTISAGAVISTQPNTGDEQLRYTVDSNTTFSAQISGETVAFKDGDYDYPLAERLIGSVTTITGTVSSLPYTFIQNTDFQIESNIDIDNPDIGSIVDLDTMQVALQTGGWFGATTLIDSLDVTTGWAASAEGSIALNNTAGEMKEGIACLNLQKASGVQITVLYDKTQASTKDFTNKTVFFWYYIDNKTHLAVANAVQFRFGNDNANYWYKNFNQADLSNGWNLLSFTSATATGSVGGPALATCDYSGVSVTYINATTVKTGNQQRLDYLRLAYVPIEDAADYRQGTKSLRFTKLDITTTTIAYEKVETSTVNSLGENLQFWLKILDAPALAKIASIIVTFGSGGGAGNSYTATFAASELATDWNRYTLVPTSAGTVISGVPNTAAMNYIKIQIVTNNVADVLSSGDVKFDYLYFAASERYIGDAIQFLKGTGTMPDSGTDFLVTYKPLSKEVPCTAETVGIKYNVGRNKIIFKVSVIANVDNVNNYSPLTGGTDEEIDADFRIRIQFAAETAGKATVEAIRQAVLAVNGVVAVTVDDLPLNNTLNEPHIYSTVTQDYPLDFEIALDNVNLVVTGLVSTLPVTFINGTDYILIDNKIRFQIGGSNPDNTSTFLVDYDYNWLGHVQLFVTGSTTPLPTLVSTDVSTAIVDTKAAGVTVSWAEPTVVAVNVTTLIAPDTAQGYTFSALQPEVENAIYQFLNNLGPGEDVYLAALYQVIQNVAGVLNSSITSPATDTTIDPDQVARSGTITIGSL